MSRSINSKMSGAKLRHFLGSNSFCRINFGTEKADFMFIDETQMKFTWGKGDDLNLKRYLKRWDFAAKFIVADSYSMRIMKLEDTFKSEASRESYTFRRYSFEIEADNEVCASSNKILWNIVHFSRCGLSSPTKLSLWWKGAKRERWPTPDSRRN